MSHTSQRRGLNASDDIRELIVLAFVPPQYEELDGIAGAMKDLARTLLKYNPDNWISRNCTEIDIPDLGRLQPPIEWIAAKWPQRAEKLLMTVVGYASSVITAVYNDTRVVSALLKELKGDWYRQNSENGYPISIVLSGLPDHVNDCCRTNQLKPHTYLQSLGYFGKVKDLPSELELSLITMCGHGLISVNRIRYLAAEIRNQRISAREAAFDIAAPCVCGTVNLARAESIFTHLAVSV